MIYHFSRFEFFACFPRKFQALVSFSSGNDNLTFLPKLSLLYAFQANSGIGTFIVSEMTENPTTKYENLVSCEPVD